MTGHDLTRVVTVVGSTATGKSALGIALAQALDGEIINADSMQLYRGMDIGTAKLTADEQGGVSHHLLDIWDVTQTASVADYQQRARAAIADIVGRGKLAILVGGSGLYLTSAIDEISFPGTDPTIRNRLETELAEIGSGAMHRRLAAIDPAVAASILPSNGRKIVRALEVRELTGEPFVAKLEHGLAPAYDAVQIGLRVTRPVLYERTDARVEVMWATGFVDEVRRLAAAGLREGVTARRALGYAQVLSMLDGEMDELQTIAATQQATRRFARRQESWFNRDPRINWLDGESSPLEQLERAVALCGANSSSSGVWQK